MLGKLIKHEWRDTCGMGLLMVFLCCLVTFLGWLSFQSPMWRQMKNNSFDVPSGVLDMLSLLVLLMYVFLLVGISYGMLIYLGVHFYRTMYSSRGYLTHTLPVSENHLLIAKILVSGLWLMAIYFLIFLSVMVVFGLLGDILLSGSQGFWDFWKTAAAEVGKTFSVIGMGEVLDNYLASLIVNAILNPFITVATLFGAITVGQLFARARVLMAILCYVGVLILSSMGSTALQTALLYTDWSFDATVNLTAYTGMTVQLVIAVLLYVASYRINAKRLNME